MIDFTELDRLYAEAQNEQNLLPLIALKNAYPALSARIRELEAELKEARAALCIEIARLSGERDAVLEQLNTERHADYPSLRDEVIDACIFLMENEGKTHSAMLLRTLKTGEAK